MAFWMWIEAGNRSGRKWELRLRLRAPSASIIGKIRLHDMEPDWRTSPWQSHVELSTPAAITDWSQTSPTLGDALHDVRLFLNGSKAFTGFERAWVVECLRRSEPAVLFGPAIHERELRHAPVRLAALREIRQQLGLVASPASQVPSAGPLEGDR